MKKIISIILALSMLTGMVTAVNATSLQIIPVIVDGEEVEFPDMAPCIVNERIIVPMRAIFEKMGVEITWFEYSQTVYSQKDYTSVRFKIGENSIIKNEGSEASVYLDIADTTLEGRRSGDDEVIELDVPAQIIGGRTYVPLRAISEAFDYNVEWDEQTSTVIITSPEQKAEETYVSKLMSNLPADKNYVISPLSLKIAMMMAANGAEGDTKTEITNAFDVDDLDEYNTAVKELIENLNDEYSDGEVNITNSIWFNKEYYSNAKNADFSSDFKETVSDNYFASYGVVTDKNIVKTINDWISKATNGKIKNMLTEKNIAPTGKMPLLALVNAIYMKAHWINEFDKDNTEKDVFIDIDGNENKVDFMSQTSHFSYLDNGNTQIVALPYENGLSMYVVLGDSRNFENDIEKMEYKKVHISMPKFSTDYFVNLKEILQNMGVKKAFENDNHDFDTMVTGVPEPIKIETVMQKAIIDVDEEGTEAAAVTFIGGAGGAAYRPDEEIFEFKADNPFTYFIRDNRSGEILFAGRYVKAE